ncbi:MAG: homoserine O-acetyltransferase/O-succinyltransferase family protein, partial [Butyricicoccus sp.]
TLPEKMSGIFEHRVLIPTERLLRGFNDIFYAPHSRHTEVRASDITQHEELRLLSVSDEAGVYIASSHNGRQIFVLGHSEYDRDTLKQEYFRDLSRGLEPQLPRHYFPDDDPTQTPKVTWRSHGQLLYTNWLNYYVYQTTPYDLDSHQALDDPFEDYEK